MIGWCEAKIILNICTNLDLFELKGQKAPNDFTCIFSLSIDTL